ncbi:restriction endonuclease subunit S [Methanospirillum hungatei]|uniref:restriction endonuclease subunit S n=1 Tax=Methanospirillum hungatei TaxID=2203 RepID=UPI0026EF57A3|nr:restriction endonuclease subunit S [Methanospirillum hungatei]MCA1915155.1 restriction endonuclease subunit S [Methanospirillum hungatei]
MSWSTVTIGDLVENDLIELQTGPFGTQLKASDYTSDGTPVINVRNIGYRVLNPEKLEYIPENVLNRLSRHILIPGDIVFGRKGAVDRHLLVTSLQNEWLQGSDCIRMRIFSDKINPDFLSYSFLLDSHKNWMLTQCGNKATMASLNQDVIKRIRLNLPDIVTQRAVVDILSKYDDLIENNRRRIQLLEEAARLLYQEWFVRLRFPGHEHTKIVDGVPEGWIQGVISDFYDTTSGGTPSRKNPEYYTGDINWVKTQELVGGFIFETSEKITQIAISQSAAKVLPKRTLLVAMYGATIGEIGILAESSACNQACCAIIPKKDLSNEIFAYFFFKDNKMRLKSLSQGAAQNNINQQVIREYPMILPSKNVMFQFLTYVNPIMNAVKNLSLTNSNLIKARDLLLPRLMNGVIPV